MKLLSFDSLVLRLGVRWETASLTDHRNIDEIFLRNVVVLDVFKFASFLQLGFLLHYPRRVSVINAKVTQPDGIYHLCCMKNVPQRIHFTEQRRNRALTLDIICQTWYQSHSQLSFNI